MSAELLAPSVKQYVFISSISVFPDDVKPGADESTPVQNLTEPGSEEVRKHYGALNDTLAFWKTLPEERRKKLRAGLSPEREQEVLAAWRSRKS